MSHQLGTLPIDIIVSNEFTGLEKSILMLFNSMPPHQTITKKELTCYFSDGFHKINTAFQRLERKGYLKRIEYRDKNGRFYTYQYSLDLHPRRKKKKTVETLPIVKLPLPEKRHSVHDLVGKIFNENCLTTMGGMEDSCVDLVVTSPPYDKLKKYDELIQFEEIAIELTRILKDGGVIVWVVGDQTFRGSETGTSFQQALFFKEKCGLRLHDTMIFQKNTAAYPSHGRSKRYTNVFEFMFVFSKGAPKVVNLLKDKPNRWAGWTNWGKKTQRNNGDILIEKKDIKPVPEFSVRNNIWKYTVGKGFMADDDLVHEHPAVFPLKLAEDHINTWTNPGDVVYDPFAGSGQTLIAAKKLSRLFLGSEINKNYEKLMRKRLRYY